MKKVLKTAITLLLVVCTVASMTACGHTHTLVEVPAKAANCQEGGYDAYYKCEGCDLIFADAAGATTLEAIPETKKSNSHDWVEGEAIKAATCDEAGEAKFACSVCGKERTATVDALGHEYKEDGSCKNCGEKTEGFVFEEGADGNYMISGYTGTDTKIIIPATYNGKKVTFVDRTAFRNNKTIKEVIFVGNNVTELDTNSFNGCTALENVTLPSGVTSLGWSGTFAGCEKLQEITIPAGVTRVNEYTFSGCYKLATVNVLGTLTIIEKQAFLNCTSLTEFNFKEGLKTLGENAFGGTKLSSITLPASLETMGAKQFVNNNFIESITVADGNAILKVTDGCLIDVATNTVVAVTKSVKAIPDGVVAIAPTTMLKANYLSELYIPKSVTTIDAQVFDRANAFTIKYQGSEAEWNAITKGDKWDNSCEITVVYNATK